jgi:hypothetical protein
LPTAPSSPSAPFEPTSTTSGRRSCPGAVVFLGDVRSTAVTTPAIARPLRWASRQAVSRASFAMIPLCLLACQFSQISHRRAGTSLPPWVYAVAVVLHTDHPALPCPRLNHLVFWSRGEPLKLILLPILTLLYPSGWSAAAPACFALPHRRSRGHVRCWHQFAQPTPWASSWGQEERIGVGCITGDVTIGRNRHTGNSPCRHGRRRPCCRALTSQPSPPACAREASLSVTVSSPARSPVVNTHRSMAAA